MADWVEGYQDELYRVEQLGKVGSAFADEIRAAMSRPGTARTIFPTTPLKGKIPMKSVKVHAQAMNAAFAVALDKQRDDEDDG